MANRYLRSTGGNWGTAGTWELTPGGGESVAVPTASDDVFLVVGSGNLTINSSPSNCKTFDATGYTGTVTHNAVQLVSQGNITFVSGMTYSIVSGASISFGASGTLTTGTKLMPSITVSSGTLTLGDNLTFYDVKTNTFTIAGTAIAMNGKSINGFSSTSRILVRSTTLGTAKSITSATTSFTNADFRDITFSSASSLDLSAITGLSGDCGGNSITGGGSTLTFTTPATQTWDGTTGSWSDSTKWTSRVPLPQDTAVVGTFGGTGRTLTIDMPRICKDLDASAPTNSPTLTKSIAFEIYGSMTLASGLTWTSAAFYETFIGRGTHTITSAGKQHNRATIAPIGGSASYTLQDAFTAGFESLFIGGSGTFDANDFNVTGFQITFATTPATGTVYMGNGTWTCGRNTTNNWNMASGITLNAEGSTIDMGGSGTSNGFNGQGKTYNNVNFNGASGTVQGSNTFNTITISAGKTVTFTSGTTQTVSNFVATGTAGNLVTINASTGGSAATLTAANTIPKNNDYMSITDINVTNGTFFYGGHSTYVSGTGWKQGNSSDMFRSLY